MKAEFDVVIRVETESLSLDEISNELGCAYDSHHSLEVAERYAANIAVTS